MDFPSLVSVSGRIDPLGIGSPRPEVVVDHEVVVLRLAESEGRGFPGARALVRDDLFGEPTET